MADFYQNANTKALALLLSGDLEAEGFSPLAPKDPSLEGREKHVPLVHEEKGKVYVQVGSVPHPMTPEHYIDWIYVLTDQGIRIKPLHPNQEPKAVFPLNEGEVVLEVFAHCNLHGLWKADI